MSILERARHLRAVIEEMATALGDEAAVENKELFKAWAEDTAYAVDQRVRYDGDLYKCLQTHTSQAAWTPTAAPSLWAKVLIPEPTEIPDWEQPSSTNPYMQGDKVRHNGKVWESIMDYNVFEPGVAGWVEI